MELASELKRSGKRTNRALAGVLFLGAVDAAYNAYSATNSSPQTSDVFGDASRRSSLMWYVTCGHVSAVLLAILSAIISASIWPLVGFGVIIAQMGWLYRRAFNRAAERDGGAGGASETYGRVVATAGIGGQKKAPGSARTRTPGYAGDTHAVPPLMAQPRRRSSSR